MSCSVGTGYAPRYDGAVSDYFLVRTAAFTPHGTMSDDELARENLIELRWWSLPDIVGYRGPDVFGPRDLGNLLAALMTDGVPVEPIAIGV